MNFSITIDADSVREIAQVIFDTGGMDAEAHNQIQNFSDRKISCAIESIADDNDEFWAAINDFYVEVIEYLNEG